MLTSSADILDLVENESIRSLITVYDPSASQTSCSSSLPFMIYELYVMLILSLLSMMIELHFWMPRDELRADSNPFACPLFYTTKAMVL